MRMFNYNNKTILGIGEWDAQEASEIVRVRGMANIDAEVGKWVEKDRAADAGPFYEDDELTRLLTRFRCGT